MLAHMRSPATLVKFSDYGQFLGEVDLCKCVLLTKQVNPVTCLHVCYFCDHAKKIVSNFHSTAMVCCLHAENTWRPLVFHLHVTQSGPLFSHDKDVGMHTVEYKRGLTDAPGIKRNICFSRCDLYLNQAHY